jgi:hypothetical protein
MLIRRQTERKIGEEGRKGEKEVDRERLTCGGNREG